MLHITKIVVLGHEETHLRRLVEITLSNELTYLLQSNDGEFCFSRIGKPFGKQVELTEEIQRLINAAGEFYRFWLNGHQEPMTLLLDQDSPALHEAYEKYDDDVQPAASLNLQGFVNSLLSGDVLRKLATDANVPLQELIHFHTELQLADLNESEMARLTYEALLLGYQPAGVAPSGNELHAAFLLTLPEDALIRLVSETPLALEQVRDFLAGATPESVGLNESDMADLRIVSRNYGYQRK